MSLLDANLSRLDNQNNITLPPISSIIKSIDQQAFVPNGHSHMTHTVAPLPSYPPSINDYTYQSVRTNSQDSIATSPSAPVQIIQTQQPSPYHLQVPQQLHHDPSLSPQPHSTPSPTIPSISIPSVSPVSSTQSIPATKRRYSCKTCSKSFTTSGHLARHSRIHTGERKHVCPFPNCDSRFARQDNCMQHYKTHLNNKMKRRKYTKKALS